MPSCSSSRRAPPTVDLVDANVLLYAYDATSERHEEARSWLETTFAGRDPVRMTWATVLAFLRIATHVGVLQQPMSPEEATEIVSEWFDQPCVEVIEPGERRWEILSPLVVDAQARGALVTDAHLAAVAIEYGAVLYTTDRDFARFSAVSTIDPL